MAAIVINIDVSITGAVRTGGRRHAKRGNSRHGVELGFGFTLIYPSSNAMSAFSNTSIFAEAGPIVGIS